MPIWTILALAFLALPLSAADGGGLAIGPALILVQDVPVGQPFTLGEAAKVRYQIVNNSAEDAVYSVKVVVPAAYTFSEFEKGFEPAPDASWFRLDREEVSVPAKSKVEVDLTVDIPNRPELLNRHWIVCIEAGRPQALNLGAALRLRARIMLETMASATVGEADGAKGGEIALSPSLVAMQPQADGGWSGEVRLRNNTSEAAQFALLGAHEVYPGTMLEKSHRYFPRVDQAVLGERWASAVPAVVELAAGEARSIRFTAPPQPALDGGGLREEIIFVSRRVRGEALPERAFTVADQAYERMELLRLRYQLPRADSSTP